MSYDRSEQAGPGRREERYPVQGQGRYRTGNGVAKDVAISDLSAKGCRFYDRFGNLRPGSIITFRIGSIGPIDAHVRWTEQHVSGIEFAQPLSDYVLTHIRTVFQQQADGS